jgi:hypothetical protein
MRLLLLTEREDKFRQIANVSPFVPKQITSPAEDKRTLSLIFKDLKVEQEKSRHKLVG